VTDAGAYNGLTELAALRASADRLELRQRCLVMGTPDLRPGSAREGAYTDPGELVTVGPVKIVLSEAELPGLEELVDRLAASGDRGVAIHAVSLECVVLAAHALQLANLSDQRIEHASVATPDAIATVAAAGARVVTQPGFVHAHGDRYLATVEPEDQPWLYRIAAWQAAGVRVNAGSDTPYGPSDPWLGARSAVHRMTANGARLLPGEAVIPEQALGLYAPLGAGFEALTPRVGDLADLCLLATGWTEARDGLDAGLVAATLVAGTPVWTAG
jgi:predicted amidohydrolase YtcJ